MICSYDKHMNLIPEIYRMWEYNGAEVTISSYSGDTELLREHRDWMKTLPYYYWVDEKTVVSHSSYLPNIRTSCERQNTLWDRDFKPYHDETITNIIGHTIVGGVQKLNNYLMIDTGAHSRGVLSAYDTDTGRVYQVNK